MWSVNYTIFAMFWSFQVKRAFKGLLRLSFGNQFTYGLTLNSVQETSVWQLRSQTVFYERHANYTSQIHDSSTDIINLHIRIFKINSLHIIHFILNEYYHDYLLMSLHWHKESVMSNQRDAPIIFRDPRFLQAALFITQDFRIWPNEPWAVPMPGTLHVCAIRRQATGV